MKRILQFILDKAQRKIPLPYSHNPIPKDPKLLIFDFDGTIADTFKNSVEILNEMAPEFGYRTLLGKDVKAAQDMTTRQLMRYLGISTIQLPRIALKGVKLLHSRIDQIQPISGMPELLHQLRDAGTPMGILTSNSHENVTSFLQRYHLEIFSFIRSSSRLFGKAHEIKTILHDHQINAKDVLFIGDETRDVEAAHRTKVPIVAVGWGYNSLKALTAQKPQATIEHPKELLELICLKNLKRV